MSRRHNPHAVALGSRRSPRKATTSRANGLRGGRPPQYRILDGHPVPYSLTLQRRTGEDWTTPTRLTPAMLQHAATWLRDSKPNMAITRSDGGYLYYDRITH